MMIVRNRITNAHADENRRPYGLRAMIVSVPLWSGTYCRFPDLVKESTGFGITVTALTELDGKLSLLSLPTQSLPVHLRRCT